jgi:glycosyltransferase involved in cell wall biosynthesis
MRISVSRDISGNNGLKNFTREMLECLRKLYNVKVVKNSSLSDIHLILINGPRKRYSKNVLRLDGVYYDRDRQGANNPIRHSIKNSDGVIYQSKWSKQMSIRMLQSSKPRNIICHNGVKQSRIRSADPINKPFSKMFLACAQWRTSKRPEAIINSFIQTYEKTKSDIGLFFVGKYKHHKIHPRIKYLGDIKHSNMPGIYAASDYLIHISYLESCSNVVVEALSAGMPILSNNIGGTPELVGSDGIIVDIDKLFNFRVIKSMKEIGSKSVDINKVSEGMEKMMNRSWCIERSDLDIKVAAKSYYKFFSELLSK